jgi:hypothetical protein
MPGSVNQERGNARSGGTARVHGERFSGAGFGAWGTLPRG